MPQTQNRRRLAIAFVLLGLSPLPAAAQGAGTPQATGNPYYDFLLARRLEGEGDTKGALAALQRAAAADPASAEIKAEIADIHLHREPPAREEAEKAAREALALDENNVQANTVLGYLYSNAVQRATRISAAEQVMQDARSAILHLERASAHSVGLDLPMQFALGQMYLVANEHAKAIQVLTRVDRQSPGNLTVRQLLARGHYGAGDVQAAIATLQEVIDELPQLAGELGTYQEQAGQLREAAASYTIALATQPENAGLKLRRILALYNAKEYSQAAGFAGEARREHPDNLNFPRVQARALFNAGDRSGAIAVAEAAVKTFPKDTATQFTLVDLYSDAGRSGDAEQLLRQMLAADPSSAQVLNHLGYLLATRGEQLDEAVRLVQRALDGDPGRPEYLDSLGWAHFKRGELNEALKYLNAAAEKLPDNSEVQDHLGDVHAQRGAWQEAIAAWTKALAGNGQGIDRDVLEQKLQDARRKLAQ